MIATDTDLTIAEREWLAVREEFYRKAGYVLVGASRTVEGLALTVGDIVLCDEGDEA